MGAWFSHSSGSDRSGYTNSPVLSDDDDSDAGLDYNSGSENFEPELNNREAFERLKVDPKFSDFFGFKFPDMKVGKEIGYRGWGGWRRVYEGEFTLETQKFPCLLKIFNKNETLSNLQDQWPHGMLKGGNSVFPGYFSGMSSILGGLVLDDKGFEGRFAIVLRREWGDLRQLIDLRLGIKRSERTEMEKSRTHTGRAFPDQCAKRLMLEIAIGMRQLHNHGIVHKFLKARNVFVCTPYPKVFPEVIEDYTFNVKLQDFEFSGGPIISTGFWRAPEVLHQIRELSSSQQQTVSFTTKSDVYAYAMLCYEILTGFLPFQGHLFSDYDLVISGRRPELPCGMDEWLRELIEQCWHPDPSKRPEFEDIVQVFQANDSDPRIRTVQEQIAASKFYWTAKDETAKDESDLESKAEETNREIFARLKHDPQYSRFFSYTFHNLEPKQKIAKGGQAEIFEAEFEKQNGIKVPCVMKIFDADFSLSQLEGQWPPGMFKGGLGESSGAQRFGFMGLYPGATRTCEVLGAVVLEESERFGDEFVDRFAFILNREGGDLRTLIDLRMKQHDNQDAPFTVMFATKIMYEIALGMQHLHDNGILHRDLKAANVLVTNVFGEFPSAVNDDIMDIKVADFECSMCVVGTNFWRAPEILRQLRSREKRTYTRKADVYSYAMTCYEVLTGGVPLEDRGFKVYDFAAVCERGQRPILPDRVAGWLRALIRQCWHANPSKRPEFEEIILRFQENCSFLTQDRPGVGDAYVGWLRTLIKRFWN